MPSNRNKDVAKGMLAEALNDPSLSNNVVDAGLSEILSEIVAPRLDLLDKAWDMISLAGPLSNEGEVWAAEYHGVAANICQKLPDGWTCSEELNHLGPCIATEQPFTYPVA